MTTTQPAVPTNRRDKAASRAVAGKKLRQILAVMAKRRCEGLCVYDPLPHVADFHSCKSPEILVYGSNRGGKSLLAAVEVARAVTGRDPHKKYRLHNGRCYVVGYDERHLGEVIYPKLFRAGALRMIADPVTGDFRGVRPDDPYDAAHKDQWKLAPPLIPERFIKTKSWKKKASTVPDKFVMHNGWEMLFMSSKGVPPQGSDIDLVWFDEEIENELWYPEMAARLVDRRGRFIWSATPQAATEKMLDLYKRAQNHAAAKVRSFFCSIFKNPYLDKEAVADLLEKYPEGSLDHQVRIEGKFAILGWRVYPEFSMDTHGCEPFAIPADWTRYAIVDPGHQITAVLFAAIPPPNEKHPVGRSYLYDELYIQDCDAAKFAEKMAGKCSGQNFEEFIIDRRMSRQTEVASGRNIEEQYAEALREKGLRCNRRGSGFAWGSSDVSGGIEAVHRAFRYLADNKPGCIVFRGILPNFEDEIEKHRFQRGSKGEHTDKIVRRNDHLMSCLRMFHAAEPVYVKPRKPSPAANPILRHLAKKRKSSGRANFIRLGPGLPS